ncbi:general substrate transporter [Ilyonectria robusta]|uniref:general substrate transporter n=1 Tax=Ilyonectria robusta TaxID=1079257 RepID=UPI001E8E4DFE|nr:general substrate transporter [Ilyonectria robusta]KAH8667723.1 general substrate transporter [Ilyonectria robusta]
MAAEDIKTDANHVESHDPVVTVENPNITFRDIWENRRVLGFCFIIFMLPINFGYEISTVGNLLAVIPFMKRFGEEVDGVLLVSAKDQQILNAATTVGLFVSAFATGFISDIVGRKKTIGLAGVLCIAGVLVQYFSRTIITLFGGKLLGTFGFGLGHSLGPVFVAEMAPNKLRGTCLVLVNTMIVIGQWLSSLVVYACSERTNDMAWRIPIITQVFPPCLLLLGLIILPESPSWLLIRGRTEDAKKSYLRFNGPDFDADTAVAVAMLAIRKEEEETAGGGSWLQCFKANDGRRTTIICMVYISQQFIGVNFVSGYLTYYFRLAGVKNALGVAQAAYAIQLFGNICSWPLVDRIGRRPMIVGGCITITAGLLIIGGVSTVNNQSALSATVALMTIWGFLYQMTLGATAYSVGGETPSMQLRQKTYAINIMAATAVSCMVLQVMPYLINSDQLNLGGKICFIFFAFSVPMCVYLYYCLPEMKGRNYAEIQEMFDKRIPARQFKGYVCSVQDEVVAKRIELEEVKPTQV